MTDNEKTTETVVETTSAPLADEGGPLGNVTAAVTEPTPETVVEKTTVTESESDDS